MTFVLIVLIILMVLLLSELIWRKRAVASELSRKFVHITVGSIVAFLPFFLSWNDIKLLSAAFLVVVLLSRYLKVFQAIHSVQRPTWGEVFFALAVGVIALMTHDKWIYMASLLEMSLADGLAAILGTRYGKKGRYYVFGQPKSFVGTATFFLVALLILGVYCQYAPGVNFQPVIVSMALLATLVENVGVLGLDNLLVPLLTSYLLTLYR